MKKYINNDNGAVLVTGLMFVALLSLISTTAYVVSTQDTAISANYKYSEKAFYNADAGIQYGIAALTNALESGASLPLRSEISMPIPGSGPPDGFSFSLSELIMEEPNRYGFISTGWAEKESTATIKATIKKASAISFAVFGDHKFKGYGGFSAGGANIYSYDHRSGSQPGEGFVSSGEGDIGSNGDGDSDTENDIDLKSGVTIDGNVILGAKGNPSIPADFDESLHTLNINGVQSLGPIDPDPLNVGDTSFADKFSFYNDIVNTQGGNNGGFSSTFVLTGSSATITSGNYYFDHFELKRSGGVESTLIIDASSGEINIYIEGNVVVKNTSVVNIISSGGNKVNIFVKEPSIWIGASPLIDVRSGSIFNVTGHPTDFAIFSNSDDKIRYHSNTAFKGLLYAPYATVELKNSSEFFGSVWAGEIHIKNHMTIYYDTAFRDEYYADKVLLTSWQLVLN